MRGPRQVTALRRGGKLDEAFKLASEQVAAPGADEWDIGDLGWCLIDLVKRDVTPVSHPAITRVLG